MPELSKLTPYGLPALVFKPENPSSYFNRELPTAPVLRTDKLSKAQAVGAIANALGNLPHQMTEGYQKGFNIGRSRKLSEDPNNEVSYSSDGTMTVRPLSSMNKALKQQQIDEGAVDIKIKKQQIDNDPWTRMNALLSGGSGDASAEDAGDLSSGSTNLTVFGLVPDGKGGYAQDPQDAVDAAKGIKGFDARKGAWGANIKDPSLVGAAVSPERLKAAGINPNDATDAAAAMVEVTAPDGTKHIVPVVDKNGTGSIDLTYGAWKKMGLPDTPGGTSIPGAKFRVFKQGADPQGEYSQTPQVSQVAPLAGLSAPRMTLDAQPTASTAPAPEMPLASLRPAGHAQAPAHIAGGRYERGPDGRSILQYPSPDSTEALFYEGPGAKPIKIPIPGKLAGTKSFATKQEMSDYYKANGSVVTKSISSPEGKWYAQEVKDYAPIDKDTEKQADELGISRAGKTQDEITSEIAKTIEQQKGIPVAHQKEYFRFEQALARDPVVKDYDTARSMASHVRDDLAGGKLTPATALGAIDSFVRAMSGGKATSSMTHILDEAQTLSQQVKLKWQKVTGGAGDNAIMTPDMAKDVSEILNRIEASSRKLVEDQKEGQKKRWKGRLKDGADQIVEDSYAPILGGDVIESPATAKPAAPSAKPTIEETASQWNALKADYDAGKLDSEPETKARAEKMLRRRGLLR